LIFRRHAICQPADFRCELSMLSAPLIFFASFHFRRTLYATLMMIISPAFLRYATPYAIFAIAARR